MVFFLDKIVGTVLIDLLFNYMNRQYSYNNLDYEYMHRGQLLLFYTYFCVDGLLTFFKDPKTRKPERVNLISLFKYGDHACTTNSRLDLMYVL